MTVMTMNLIDRLASDARPVKTHALQRTFAAALGVGGLCSFALVVLVFGVQPNLGDVAHGGPLAMKAAYAGTVGAIALAIAGSLARPGRPVRSWAWVAVPIAALAALGIYQLATSPPAGWPALLLGGSWTRCPWRITGLALPVMAALMFAVRQQAPVDLRRAGAEVGLVAGAAAAAIYALACTETSPSFVLIWYSTGIALATTIGAALGPRLLRW